MELRQLRYFVATARYLNFSRAAEALYISQPALSHQIIELEKELKVQLFQRDRRNVSLTAEGAELLEYAKHIVLTADHMMTSRGVRSKPEAMPGQLRAAFDSGEHPNGWMEEGRVLSSFLARNPAIQPTVVQLTQEECEEKVLTQELDLAFVLLRHNERPSSELSSRLFFPDRMVLLVRADSQISTLEDAIHQLPLTILKTHPKAQPRIVRGFTELGLTPSLLYQESILGCIVMAQAGKASMVIPMRNYLAFGPNNLRVIPIPGDSVNLCRAVLWSPKNKNEALRLFLEHSQGML